MKNFKVLSILWKTYQMLPRWKEKRSALLIDRNHMCEKCQSKDYLQCHHVSYDNLFDEKLSDLQLLCGRCHRIWHANNKKFGINLTVVTMQMIENFETMIIPDSIKKERKIRGPRITSEERKKINKENAAQRKIDRKNGILPPIHRNPYTQEHRDAISRAGKQTK